MPDLIDRAVEFVKSPNYIEMTTRQLAVLGEAMAAPQPLKVRELAKLLNVSKPVVTRALIVLSDMGLIERQRGRDRRDRFVHVTPAATEFRAKLGGQA